MTLKMAQYTKNGMHMELNLAEVILQFTTNWTQLDKNYSRRRILYHLSDATVILTF